MDVEKMRPVLRKNKWKATALQILGWCGTVCCLPLALAGAATIETALDAVMSVFFVAFSVISIRCIGKGAYCKRMIELFPDYAIHLSMAPMGMSEEAAKTLGESKEKFEKNLAFMVRRGFFPGYFLDREKGRFIEAAAPQAIASFVVKCPGCGATNRIGKGEAEKCKYCGIPLEKETKTNEC